MGKRRLPRCRLKSETNICVGGEVVVWHSFADMGLQRSKTPKSTKSATYFIEVISLGRESHFFVVNLFHFFPAPAVGFLLIFVRRRRRALSYLITPFTGRYTPIYATSYGKARGGASGKGTAAYAGVS